MFIVVLIIGVAILAGYVTGGRLAGLSRIHPRWWGLAFAGLALQSAPLPGGLDRRLGAVILLASYGLLLTFVLLNRRFPGSPLLIGGLALNLAVIGANGGMPVSEEALLASGQGHAVSLLRETESPKHHLMRSDDLLAPLADVIPIPPPLGVVVSVGDIAMYAGVAWFVFSATRGPVAGIAPAWAPFEGYRGKHRPRRPARIPGAIEALARSLPPRGAGPWGNAP